jgi:cyclopropane-fatty-acyl-phospholipid synthase
MTNLTIHEPPTSGSGASAEAIQAHYDVSNEFYAAWLDASMTYSCALWNEGDDLQRAQIRKLDFHLDQPRAREKTNLLDVGCGWGALLERASAVYQVESVVGLTLSAAQAEWVNARKRQNVSVRLESWENHLPLAPYDAIVSVGAFEHFAKVGASKADKIAAYRKFFRWCYANSTDDCSLSMQTIVYENYDDAHPNPFVQEIFPESELPRVSEIAAACEGLYEIVQLFNHRSHYTKTLQAWYSSLRENRIAIIEMVGETVYRKYEKYLGVFVVGFHMGTVNLSRFEAKKITKTLHGSNF